MRYLVRYFIWLAAVIGLVIILIILLLPSSKKKTMSGQEFINYSSTSATASMLIDAPEGAESTHQAVRITVGENQVTFQQLAGYGYRVVNTKTFNNNQIAYNTFLRSLYFADFLKGNTSPTETNPSGICPLGDRYIFNFDNGSQNIEHFWRTTCGTKTYDGNFDLTVLLFQNQVPNYDNLTGNIAF